MTSLVWQDLTRSKGFLPDASPKKFATSAFFFLGPFKIAAVALWTKLACPDGRLLSLASLRNDCNVLVARSIVPILLQG